MPTFEISQANTGKIQSIGEGMDFPNLLEILKIVPAWCIPVALLVFVVANHRHFFEMLDANKKRKSALIKGALDSGFMEESDKTYLTGIMRTQYFQAATGIYVEDSLRSLVINLYQNANGRISYDDLRKAQYNLEIRDGKLSITHLGIERVGAGLNLLLLLTFFLFGVFLVFYGVFAKFPNDISHIVISGIGFLFFMIGAFISKYGTKYFSMKKIKDEIERQRKLS